jgi:glycosyltransferase involved in cell wall biosynthesis
LKKKPSPQKRRQLVSIVIPVLNEAEVLPLLLEQLATVLRQLPYEFELIFVDDGSTDESFALLSRLAGKDSRIKAISFSRNFGHQAALTAGLQHSNGDAVITMDADLQHPPSLIPTLLERWQAGFKIVKTSRSLSG